jgi:hypothetical protein
MLSDNKRLYDLSTRMALYIEGIKVQHAREFNSVLLELSEIFKSLLGRIQYKTLDGLSKAKLNALILELRKSQSKIYTKYTEKLLKQLEDFTAVALEVNRRVYASQRFLDLNDESDQMEILSYSHSEDVIETESKDNKLLFPIFAIFGKNNGIYKAGLNTPIPANGYYPIPFVKAFSVSAQASTENIIRKGWANKQTPAQTLSELVGNQNQPIGLASQVSRIRNQAAAVIETTIGHFGNLAGAAVQSALFGWYMWVSIIDGNTTDICIRRNLQTYRYGSGPIPPAHIRCRSHITPMSILNDNVDETYYVWMSRQPDNIQNDFLGEKVAANLRAGRLKAKDLSKHTAIMPITLKEFLGKVESILT